MFDSFELKFRAFGNVESRTGPGLDSRYRKVSAGRITAEEKEAEPQTNEALRLGVDPMHGWALSFFLLLVLQPHRPNGTLDVQ